MAYNAEINVSVKNLNQVTDLEAKLSSISRNVNALNKGTGGGGRGGGGRRGVVMRGLAVRASALLPRESSQLGSCATDGSQLAACGVLLCR